MARTVWTGSLSFGLVNVPVGLYPATKDKAIHFNQLQAGTADRIRYKKVNERTGEEVPAEEIVRGMDMGGGEYVLVTDDDLAAAEPEGSREIDVLGFVDLADIDPIFFRSSYYMAPAPKGPDKAYALLRAAMRRSNRVAIARLIMRGKEYLVAVRPADDVLVVETLYFADEIRRPAEELPPLPGEDGVSDRELEMANLLLDSMAMDWDPGQFHDTYREKVEALLEEKRQGHQVAVAAGPRPQTQVVDLMAALEASMTARRVADIDGDSGAHPGGEAPVPKKAAARRTGTKKTPAAKKATPAKKAAAAKKAAKKSVTLRRVS